MDPKQNTFCSGLVILSCFYTGKKWRSKFTLVTGENNQPRYTLHPCQSSFVSQLFDV